MPLAPAQVLDFPHGMYCGGNQLVYEGEFPASIIDVVVVDPSDYPVPARVQVQLVGRDDIVIDRHADKQGRLKLRSLRSGEYWLGVSYPGFNLHYWHRSESRKHRKKVLRVALSVGT